MPFDVIVLTLTQMEPVQGRATCLRQQLPKTAEIRTAKRRVGGVRRSLGKQKRMRQRHGCSSISIKYNVSTATPLLGAGPLRCLGQDPSAAWGRTPRISLRLITEIGNSSLGLGPSITR